MKYGLLLLSLCSFHCIAKTDAKQCVAYRGDIGVTMLMTMKEDFNISKSDLLLNKTKVKIINEEPVNFLLAKTYGLQEKILSGNGSDDPTTVDEYAESFMSNNAKNTIIEYTFENKKNMKNILLASAFISDKDCLVRFNGYIILKREF